MNLTDKQKQWIAFLAISILTAAINERREV